jgi:hypothetical protein
MIEITVAAVADDDSFPFDSSSSKVLLPFELPFDYLFLELVRLVEKASS